MIAWLFTTEWNLPHATSRTIYGREATVQYSIMEPFGTTPVIMQIPMASTFEGHINHLLTGLCGQNGAANTTLWRRLRWSWFRWRSKQQRWSTSMSVNYTDTKLVEIVVVTLFWNVSLKIVQRAFHFRLKRLLFQNNYQFPHFPGICTRLRFRSLSRWREPFASFYVFLSNGSSASRTW